MYCCTYYSKWAQLPNINKVMRYIKAITHFSGQIANARKKDRVRR